MKIMHRLRRGESWGEIFDNISMLNVDEYQNFIVVHGPCPNINADGMRNFHIYVLHDVIKYYWTSKLEDFQEQDEIELDLFNHSLQQDWSTLGLISTKNKCWISFGSSRYYDQTTHLKYRPLVRACLTYWPTFSIVGKRYSFGLPEGHELWSLPLGIRYVLLQMDVPLEVIQQPLPSDRGLDIINDWIKWE